MTSTIDVSYQSSNSDDEQEEHNGICYFYVAPYFVIICWEVVLLLNTVISLIPCVGLWRVTGIILFNCSILIINSKAYENGFTPTLG